MVNPHLAKTYKGALAGIFVKEPHPLIIMAQDAAGEHGDRESLLKWSLSKESLPDSADVEMLSPNEDFVPQMEAILQATSARAIFLMPPPLSSRTLPPHLRAEHPRRDLAQIALHVAIATLRNGCEITTLLQPHFFLAESERLNRFETFCAARPRLVLWHEHPWRDLGLDSHPQFQLHTLHVEVGGEPAPIRFARIKDIASVTDADVWLREFAVLRERTGGSSKVGYVLRDLLPPDSPVSYDLYCPELAAEERTLRQIGDVRQLADLVRITVGSLHLTAEAQRLRPVSENEGAFVIGGREIQANGTISFLEAEHRADVEEERHLRSGDLCVRLWHRSGRLRCARVPPNAPPAVASQSVLVLRPRVELTGDDTDLLEAYLQSDIAAALLSARNAFVGISPAVLGKLPVPFADSALRTALSELNESETRFRGWLDDAAHAKRALFSFASLEDARVKVLATGRLARQRARAGEQVEEFRHRVRSQFPHPLAYRWRIVDSSHRDLEGYLRVIDCAEVAVSYTACVGMAACAAIPDLKMTSQEQMAKHLGRGRGGISMGHWVAVLREMRDSRSIRGAVGFPFPEFITLLGDREVDESLQALSRRRNDQAHRRGPKGPEVEAAFEEASTELLVLLRALEFLVDYPLVYVESTIRDSMKRVTRLVYRELMGDHALVPFMTRDVEDAEVEAGSLYLSGRDQQLYLLRPFISWRECRTTHQRAMFYLDKYEPTRDVCLLTSMEHGHTISDNQVAESFRQLGLLPSRAK